MGRPDRPAAPTLPRRSARLLAARAIARAIVVRTVVLALEHLIGRLRQLDELATGAIAGGVVRRPVPREAGADDQGGREHGKHQSSGHALHVFLSVFFPRRGYSLHPDNTA